MKTILTPIDFSPISERVVAAAADLARATEGKVILLHVIVLPPDAAGFALAIDRYSTLANEAEKAADNQLAAYQARLTALSVASESKRVTGFPHQLIPKLAKKLSADYVIMGSHGHTALYDLVVGNTTRAVMTDAGCPVIIVPAKVTASAKEPAQVVPQLVGA